MSWHYKENCELSEVHPRRQPPKGRAGQHAVAKIQPIVPDVSMVSHREPRQPLGVLNGQREKSYEDSLCRSIPACVPPQPQQPPLRVDLRPPELSMLYREDSTAENLKRMNLNSKNDSLAQDKLTLDTSTYLLKIIQAQSVDIDRLNRQFADLQKCVDYLMQNSKDQHSNSRQSYQQNVTPLMVDSSTQVSAPGTPVKARATPTNTPVTPMNSHNESESILRVDGSHLNPSLHFEPVETQSSLPLGLSAGGLTQTETEAKLQMQDVVKTKDIDELIANYGYESPNKNETAGIEVITPVKPIEESCVAVRRIHDLGVSFIARDDLYSKVEPRKDEQSIWIPHAANPFKNAGPIVASTSEHSLMLNDMAMKYLNDDHLVHMARNSPLNQQNNSSYLNTPTNVTRYGMPENNASVATLEHLKNYNLKQ